MNPRIRKLLIWIVAFEHHPSLIVFCRALEVLPLPKFSVDSLSLEQFDEVYLDKLPVIISGSTACPKDVDFTNIHDVCVGKLPGNFVHTKFTKAQQETNETYWAGLKAGAVEETVDFGSFVREMGTKEELRFMFDLPMVEICPSLPPKIRIPPHFVSIFSSHFMYRHLSKDYKTKNSKYEWKKLCPKLPFFNMYLAEGGFETDLHIDSLHSAFVASMCVGRKRWRVMTSVDFATVYDKIGVGGLQVNGTWVMSSIVSPIDTWSPSGLLESLDVTIYEADLEPGEAMGFCDMWIDSRTDEDLDLFSEHCKGFRRVSSLMRKNHAHYTSNGVERTKEITLAEATGCKSTFDLLDNVPENNEETLESGKLLLTPHNFRNELTKGPLIVMKNQNVAGVCLYFLKNWKKWTKGFDPPIRVGVLSCIFQNQCSPGGDPFYKQLIDKMEERETPTFLYVEPPKHMNQIENPNLFFSFYHGFLGIDDLRIWISMQTGSTMTETMPLGTVLFWRFFHMSMQTVDYLGPTLFGFILALCIITLWFGAIFLLDKFFAYMKANIERSNAKRSRHRKLDDKLKDV